MPTQEIADRCFEVCNFARLEWTENVIVTTASNKKKRIHNLTKIESETNFGCDRDGDSERLDTSEHVIRNIAPDNSEDKRPAERLR